MSELEWDLRLLDVQEVLELTSTLQDVMGMVKASPVLVSASLSKLLVLVAREGSLGQLSEHPDSSRCILNAIPPTPSQQGSTGVFLCSPGPL